MEMEVGPRPRPWPHPAPEFPGGLGAAMRNRPADPAMPAEPTLRRFEFVAACQALLADDPGCASTSHLHELFDVLDPDCTGSVSLHEFSRLLRTHRKEETSKREEQRLWQELGVSTAASSASAPSPSQAVKSPFGGIRMWMLQQGWVFQDLVRLLGAPQTKLSKGELQSKLIPKIPAPWLTAQGVSEIFLQLHVHGDEGRDSKAIRVEDILEALLDSEQFSAEITQRCIRLVFREAHHRDPRVNVRDLCRGQDKKRVGILSSTKQLKDIIEGVCPSLLADLDISLLFKRFAPAKATFRYDEFLKALDAEKGDYFEHILVRALPELIKKHADFERYAQDADLEKSGQLSARELAPVLSRLRLGLCEQGLKELDDFMELIAKATGQAIGTFKYEKLVKNAQWVGPSLEAAIKSARGKAISAASNADCPPKRYLLAIFFYKTAQYAAKLGLSAHRAFDRLDRGGKGFLSADDLRLAIVDVLGSDETLADLGLTAASKMFFPEFEKRLDFNMKPLAGDGLNVVFELGTEALTEKDFCGRLNTLGVDDVTSKSWLHLIYPAGIPANGVERRVLQTYLATHSDAAPAVSSAIMARRRLLAASPALRQSYFDTFQADANTTDSIRRRIPKEEARELLRRSLGESDAVEVLKLTAKASSCYECADDLPVESIRLETLLCYAEPYVEHILEVSLSKISGLEGAKAPAVAGIGQLELALKYRLHGSEHAAETAGLAAGTEDASSANLEFAAQHIFCLTQQDRLSSLFERAENVLAVQAWAGACGGTRQILGIATLKARELNAFLEAGLAATGTPEALLGSRKEWSLPFETPPASLHLAGVVSGDAKKAGTMKKAKLVVAITYSRRTPTDQQKVPFPWTALFSGRSVLCRRAVGPDEDGVDWYSAAVAATKAAEAEAAKKKKIDPGTVVVKVELEGLVLHDAALRKIVARCIDKGTVTSAVSTGMALLVGFNLFPSKNGSSDIYTPAVKVPEEFFTGGSGDSVRVPLNFSWKAQPLRAKDAVDLMKDGSASLELWLRMNPNAGSLAPDVKADVRVAEASEKLQNLLLAMSPEAPAELRLRTLTPASIKPLVSFKSQIAKDNELVAELESSFAIELPGGPSHVAWLLPAPKPPAASTLPKAKYTITLCEVLLSHEFAAMDANRTSTTTSVPKGMALAEPSMYFYAEVGSSCRSAPVLGVLDDWGIVRILPGDDARAVLSDIPLPGESKEKDAELAKGVHHKLKIRVLRLSGGARCSAEVSLTLPHTRADGLPSFFFGGRLWLALYHAAPDAPSLSIVGRALIAIESECKQGGSRAFGPLPMAPSGVWLPLYKSWSPLKGDWAIEKTLNAAVGGKGLWTKMQDAEKKDHEGIVSAEDFTRLLNEAGMDQRDLLSDLSFLRTNASGFLANDSDAVPYKQLLQWIIVRDIARRVLPVVAKLWRRLRELDKLAGPDSGTVPFSFFQDALRVEVDLSASVWEVIARRPQWLLEGTNFYGREHFDYFTFFWDLRVTGVGCDTSDASGSGGAPPPPMPGMAAAFAAVTAIEKPRGAELNDGRATGQVLLSILSALHLPKVDDRTPSVCATLQWATSDSSDFDEGTITSNELGRTAVVQDSSNPQFFYKMMSPLPQLFTKDGQPFDYPAAFAKLALRVSLWHVDDARKREVGIGAATISLAPLRSKGFPKIDGYYKVIGNGSTPLTGLECGQIRVVVEPQSKSASTELAHQHEWKPSLHDVFPKTSMSSSLAPTGQLPRCWVFSEDSAIKNSRKGFGYQNGPCFTPDPAAEVVELRPGYYSDVPLSSVRISPPQTSYNSDFAFDRLPSVFQSKNQRDVELRSSVWPGPVVPFIGGIEECSRRAGVQDDVSETALRFASRLSENEQRLRSMDQIEDLRAQHLENLAMLDMLQKSRLPGISEPAMPSLSRGWELSGGRGPLSNQALAPRSRSPPCVSDPNLLSGRGPLPDTRPSFFPPLASSNAAVGLHEVSAAAAAAVDVRSAPGATSTHIAGAGTASTYQPMSSELDVPVFQPVALPSLGGALLQGDCEQENIQAISDPPWHRNPDLLSESRAVIGDAPTLEERLAELKMAASAAAAAAAAANGGRVTGSSATSPEATNEARRIQQGPISPLPVPSGLPADLPLRAPKSGSFQADAAVATIPSLEEQGRGGFLPAWQTGTLFHESVEPPGILTEGHSGVNSGFARSPNQDDLAVDDVALDSTAGVRGAWPPLQSEALSSDEREEIYRAVGRCIAERTVLELQGPGPGDAGADSNQV